MEVPRYAYVIYRLLSSTLSLSVDREGEGKD